MLHYRLLRAVNRGYSIAVLWTYVAAFFIGWAFVFVFPQITLALVFLGLLGLVGAVIGARVLAFLQEVVARGSLAAGSCPGCGAAIEHPADEPGAWSCSACGGAYSARGAERREP
jgi:ribosomal protein L37AE/L43A